MRKEGKKSSRRGVCGVSPEKWEKRWMIIWLLRALKRFGYRNTLPRGWNTHRTNVFLGELDVRVFFCLEEKSKGGVFRKCPLMKKIPPLILVKWKRKYTDCFWIGKRKGMFGYFGIFWDILGYFGIFWGVATNNNQMPTVNNSYAPKMHTITIRLYPWKRK